MAESARQSNDRNSSIVIEENDGKLCDPLIYKKKMYSLYILTLYPIRFRFILIEEYGIFDSTKQNAYLA